MFVLFGSCNIRLGPFNPELVVPSERKVKSKEAQLARKKEKAEKKAAELQKLGIKPKQRKTPRRRSAVPAEPVSPPAPLP